MLKVILGCIAIGLGGVAYTIYFSNVLRGRVKPAAISWLLWALVTGMAFEVQRVKFGGAGAWATGASSIACLVIGFTALRFDRRCRAWDAVFVIGSLAALFLWIGARDITSAAVALTATDVIAYGPTLSKGWMSPDEDLIASFALNSLKYGVAIAALQTYSLETWLYPGALILMNGIVAAMLYLRRQSARSAQPVQ